MFSNVFHVQDTKAVFAQRLRELREARGLSQARLAAQVASMHGLTLDPTAITRIEGGRRSVSLTEAVAFAAVLGASVDEMCTPGPGGTERELRRELAQAEAQLANAEGAMYSADYAYTGARERVEDLRGQIAALGGGEGAAP
jgi:transcriptional regulator with XRE-family HTH domain